MLQLRKLARLVTPASPMPLAGNLLPPLALGLLAALTIYAVYRSLAWPMIVDAPLMHYIAGRVLAGDVPYKDIADMNLPGTYLLHMLILSTIGGSDGAWRLFDLLWSLLAAASVYTYCRPFSTPIAAGAGLLFILYHLSSGPHYSGQRDFVIVPLLVFALLLHTRLLEGSVGRPALFVAGLLIGTAGTIKPYTCLLLALLVGLQFVVQRRALKRALADSALLAAGAALPVAAVIVWLALIGALESMISFNILSLMPFYSEMMRLGLMSLLLAMVYLAFKVGVAIALPLSFSATTVRQPRHWLALIGALYGVAHYLIQNKGWLYHLYPLFTFLLILSAIGIATALQASHRRKVMAWTAMALIVGLIAVPAIQTVRRTITLATYRPLVVSLTADLQALGLGPDDTVQVFDSVDGGIHALFRLGLHQPSRFIYDFYFFYAPEHPITHRLRQELIDSLQQERPKAIVVFSDPSHSSHEIGRVATFPALRDLLEHDYTVAVDRINPQTRSGYRLYTLRAG